MNLFFYRYVTKKQRDLNELLILTVPQNWENNRRKKNKCFLMATTTWLHKIWLISHACINMMPHLWTRQRHSSSILMEHLFGSDDVTRQIISDCFTIDSLCLILLIKVFWTTIFKQKASNLLIYFLHFIKFRVTYFAWSKQHEHF